MFIKVDADVIALLCCALCKSQLVQSEAGFRCEACGTAYPKRGIDVGGAIETVYDFRVQRPAYCAADTMWRHGQEEFEKYHADETAVDDLQHYRDEIDSVTEIYTREFKISGAVLDAGGHQGRLRHYLDESVSMYVSIDPFANVFEGVATQPNLLQAYHCLSEPCNFLLGRAEELPFVSSVFDWVHMRSVIDHFEDPFKAMKEAYRVLKPGGRVLIGIAIMSRFPNPYQKPLWQRIRERLANEGMRGVATAAAERVKSALHRHEDHHIFHPEEADLRDLMQCTGFTVEKEHWQKPPFEYCIYASAVSLKPPVRADKQS